MTNENDKFDWTRFKTPLAFDPVTKHNSDNVYLQFIFRQWLLGYLKQRVSLQNRKKNYKNINLFLTRFFTNIRSERTKRVVLYTYKTIIRFFRIVKYIVLQPFVFACSSFQPSSIHWLYLTLLIRMVVLLDICQISLWLSQESWYLVIKLYFILFPFVNS